MADGVLLVVDSVEGPKPQTRFVLDKALEKNMKVLVVVNKIDRPSARPDYVVDMVFDLFVELGASDEQTDFNVVYASGLNGQAGNEPDKLQDTMDPLFDAILESIDAPTVDTTKPDQLQALVSNIDFDPFKGKMGIARITNGSVNAGQPIAVRVSVSLCRLFMQSKPTHEVPFKFLFFSWLTRTRSRKRLVVSPTSLSLTIWARKRLTRPVLARLSCLLECPM